MSYCHLNMRQTYSIFPSFSSVLLDYSKLHISKRKKKLMNAIKHNLGSVRVKPCLTRCWFSKELTSSGQTVKKCLSQTLMHRWTASWISRSLFHARLTSPRFNHGPLSISHSLHSFLPRSVCPFQSGQLHVSLSLASLLPFLIVRHWNISPYGPPDEKVHLRVIQLVLMADLS